MILKNINLVDTTSNHKLISVEIPTVPELEGDTRVWKNIKEWVVQINYGELTNDEPKYATMKASEGFEHELVNFDGSSDYLLRKAK